MTLHLIRHARAGSPHPGRLADLARPLDPAGFEQAEAIAAELASKPVERILSSPAQRCISTVAALAERLGLDTEVVGELGEAGSSVGAVGLVRSLAERPGDSVLASHGDVIPYVLRGLARDGLHLPERIQCKKASIWELAVSDGRISGALYRHPKTFGADIPE